MGTYRRTYTQTALAMTTQPGPPRIPPPPSKEDVDQVSRDQALIADEWAPNPAPDIAAEDVDARAKQPGLAPGSPVN